MLIITILTLFISLASTLAIVVPLTGVLVRYRVNYIPKALQLDTEGVAQPRTGPVVSFVGMFVRVYKLEGWAGLYKGFMPTFLSTLVIIVVMLVALGNLKSRHGPYSTPDTGPLGTLFYGIFMMLVSLPVVILTYRAITTPRKLPFFGLKTSLRVLLTPTERQRPWLLYLTPGLMTAQIAHISYVVLVLNTLRRFLLPDLPEMRIPNTKSLSPIKVALFFVLLMISAAILAPLEVIATRLAIQRNHDRNALHTEEQEEPDGGGDLEYAGTHEDVIELRSEDDPYVGLLDCGKRIMDEEGSMVLYRAWWLTMLGGFFGAFS